MSVKYSCNVCLFWARVFMGCLTEVDFEIEPRTLANLSSKKDDGLQRHCNSCYELRLVRHTLFRTFTNFNFIQMHPMHCSICNRMVDWWPFWQKWNSKYRNRCFLEAFAAIQMLTHILLFEWNKKYHSLVNCKIMIHR